VEPLESSDRQEVDSEVRIDDFVFLNVLNVPLIWVTGPDSSMREGWARDV